MKTRVAIGTVVEQTRTELPSGDPVHIDQSEKSTRGEQMTPSVIELKSAATGLDATPGRADKLRWSPGWGGTRLSDPRMVSVTTTASTSKQSYDDFKNALTDTIKNDFAAGMQTTPDQVDLSKIQSVKWGVGIWPVINEDFFQQAYQAYQADLSSPEKAESYFEAELSGQRTEPDDKYDRRLVAFNYGILSRTDLAQNESAQAAYVTYIGAADSSFNATSVVYPNSRFMITDQLRDQAINRAWSQSAEQDKVLESLVAVCRDQNDGGHRRPAWNIARLSEQATGEHRQRFVNELERYLAPEFTDKDSEGWRSQFTVQHLSRLGVDDPTFRSALLRMVPSPIWQVAESAAMAGARLSEAGDDLTQLLLNRPLGPMSARMFFAYTESVFPDLMLYSPSQRQRIFDFLFEQHAEIFDEHTSVRHYLPIAIGRAAAEDSELKARLVAWAGKPSIPSDKYLEGGIHFALGLARVEPQKLEYQLELADGLQSPKDWVRESAEESLRFFYANDSHMLDLIQQRNVAEIKVELQRRF